MTSDIISYYTILTKFGSDCRTWVEEKISDYPNEKGNKEIVFTIKPNTPAPIHLNYKEARELKARLDGFLEGHP